MRLRLPLIVAGTLLTAACAVGGPGSGPSASPSPTAPSAPTAAGGSRLEIVVDDGTGQTTTWTLTCDPPGGSHPAAEQACAAIEAHRSALKPVDKNKMCAQVYGGPERATISGTWRGDEIFAALSRTDACETARWDALVPLVPAGGR